MWPSFNFINLTFILVIFAVCCLLLFQACFKPSRFYELSFSFTLIVQLSVALNRLLMPSIVVSLGLSLPRMLLRMSTSLLLCWNTRLVAWTNQEHIEGKDGRERREQVLI